jgi:hypothetical protein
MLINQLRKTDFGIATPQSKNAIFAPSKIYPLILGDARNLRILVGQRRVLSGFALAVDLLLCELVAV